MGQFFGTVKSLVARRLEGKAAGLATGKQSAYAQSTETVRKMPFVCLRVPKTTGHVQMIRWAVPILALVLAAIVIGPASAQEVVIKQIKLTEQQILDFISGKNRDVDITQNIALVMKGIDPVTKVYTGPKPSIEKLMAGVRNDKSIPTREKKEMLVELAAELKSARPIQYPSNVELVKKYYTQIDNILN